MDKMSIFSMSIYDKKLTRKKITLPKNRTNKSTKNPHLYLPKSPLSESDDSLFPIILHVEEVKYNNNRLPDNFRSGTKVTNRLIFSCRENGKFALLSVFFSYCTCPEE